jgi:hypothetical protein
MSSNNIESVNLLLNEKTTMTSVKDATTVGHRRIEKAYNDLLSSSIEGAVSTALDNDTIAFHSHIRRPDCGGLRQFGCT